MIGKSVYLELKILNKGRFLGEWFGDGLDIMALQAFMHPTDGEAKLKTTKFIRMPKEEKLTVNTQDELDDTKWKR